MVAWFIVGFPDRVQVRYRTPPHSTIPARIIGSSRWRNGERDVIERIDQLLTVVDQHVLVVSAGPP